MSRIHSRKRKDNNILKIIPCILLLLVFLCACSLNATSEATKIGLITAPANATATATPFQPILNESPTSVVMETSTPPVELPVWGNYPPPQVFPYYLSIPSPAEIIPQPTGQVNILLLGSDQRPNDGGFRTDTIILITISPHGDVNLTSFPRDLYVYIPGWMMQRLNTAYGYGGFEKIAMTFEYNFGVRPDYFALVNFDGFRSIVNSLGGITVQAAYNLTDSRIGYPDGYTIYAGPNLMDAETALWYVRSRSTTNDIDRLRRAQEVLQAIGLKLFTLNGLNRIPELYNTYKANVITNISLEASLRLLPAVNLLTDPSGINRYVIGYDQVYDWTVPSTGAQVLLPLPDEIRSILVQALNMP